MATQWTADDGSAEEVRQGCPCRASSNPPCGSGWLTFALRMQDYEFDAEEGGEEELFEDDDAARAPSQRPTPLSTDLEKDVKQRQEELSRLSFVRRRVTGLVMRTLFQRRRSRRPPRRRPIRLPLSRARSPRASRTPLPSPPRLLGTTGRPRAWTRRARSFRASA